MRIDAFECIRGFYTSIDLPTYRLPMTRFAASPRTLPSDTPSGSSSPLDEVKDLSRLKALLTDGLEVEVASALGFCGTGLGVAFLLVLGFGFGFGGVGGTGFFFGRFRLRFAVAAGGGANFGERGSMSLGALYLVGRAWWR